MSQECALCRELEHTIARSSHWTVALNVNQDRLGKCIVVLRRHATDALNLAADELQELWEVARALREALQDAFRPDHFNYMFLMNQDAHVFLHVIPRYRRVVTFEGETWATTYR